MPPVGCAFCGVRVRNRQTAWRHALVCTARISSELDESVWSGSFADQGVDSVQDYDACANAAVEEEKSESSVEENHVDAIPANEAYELGALPGHLVDTASCYDPGMARRYQMRAKDVGLVYNQKQKDGVAFTSYQRGVGTAQADRALMIKLAKDVAIGENEAIRLLLSGHFGADDPVSADITRVLSEHTPMYSTLPKTPKILTRSVKSAQHALEWGPDTAKMKSKQSVTVTVAGKQFKHCFYTRCVVMQIVKTMFDQNLMRPDTFHFGKHEYDGAPLLPPKSVDSNGVEGITTHTDAEGYRNAVEYVDAKLGGTGKPAVTPLVITLSSDGSVTSKKGSTTPVTCVINNFTSEIQMRDAARALLLYIPQIITKGKGFTTDQQSAVSRKVQVSIWEYILRELQKTWHQPIQVYFTRSWCFSFMAHVSLSFRSSYLERCTTLSV
jgi:hypothetical protein